MAENWEFALSHIEDGFVTIIGDDDCLIPGSEMGDFYWTVLAPDIVNPGWEDRFSIQL
jgi:hypothetical protein